MTEFEIFIATKAHYSKLENNKTLEGQDWKGPGYVYMDYIVIQEHDDETVSFINGNEELVRPAASIFNLEVEAFLFAKSSGYDFIA